MHSLTHCAPLPVPATPRPRSWCGMREHWAMTCYNVVRTCQGRKKQSAAYKSVAPPPPVMHILGQFRTWNFQVGKSKLFARPPLHSCMATLLEYQLKLACLLLFAKLDGCTVH